jgi:hypothetical protein
VKVHEALRQQAMGGEQRLHAAARVIAGLEDEVAFARRGLNADAAQGIEVALHLVASPGARRRNEVREARAPAASRAPALGRD